MTYHCTWLGLVGSLNGVIISKLAFSGRRSEGREGRAENEPRFTITMTPLGPTTHAVDPRSAEPSFQSKSALLPVLLICSSHDISPRTSATPPI